MAEHDYDLFVIGAGSGGLATSKRAASYGARVAIAESGRVGGTCVIRGCIPKKLMVYAAEHGHASDDASGYGWSPHSSTLDWERLVASRDQAVAGLEHAHEGHLEKAGVELLRGSARLVGPGKIALGGKTYTSRYVVIATGGAPVLPEIDGVEHAITSDGFFELRARPASAVIVGGGYIAVEFASILAGLGTRVTLVIRRALPLRGFDEDLRKELLDALVNAGVNVRTDTVVKSLRDDGNSTDCALEGPKGSEVVTVECAVVYATGRAPNVSALGLDKVGIALGGKGQIVVDDDDRTSVDGVFAIGDVTDRVALTPAAIQAGRALADRLFGGKSTAMSYVGIPTAVFTEPPISTVGLSEEQAVREFGADGVTVYRSGFTPLVHMLTARKVRSFLKLVVEKSSDRVVGCHMIGHDAPEIIQGFAVAMKAGATKADFDATVGIHPSTAEEFVTMM